MVVLDEFQYLGDGEAGAVEVASELNAVWERPRADRPILIVLAGSAVGTMEALAAGGGPLYGRFTWQHQLQPFGYWHTAEMVPFDDPRDRALDVRDLRWDAPLSRPDRHGAVARGERRAPDARPVGRGPDVG